MAYELEIGGAGGETSDDLESYANQEAYRRLQEDGEKKKKDEPGILCYSFKHLWDINMVGENCLLYSFCKIEECPLNVNTCLLWAGYYQLPGHPSNIKKVMWDGGTLLLRIISCS